MKRRDFISLIGGAGAAWPLAAHAQQPAQMRRVGVLESAGIETDQQAGVAVFKEVLRQLGWTEELVALQTDVIKVTGALGLQTLLQTTRSVPTVFNSI